MSGAVAILRRNIEMTKRRMRVEGLDKERFNDMGDFQSGLRGVSETSSARRDL